VLAAVELKGLAVTSARDQFERDHSQRQRRLRIHCAQQSQRVGIGRRVVGHDRGGHGAGALAVGFGRRKRRGNVKRQRQFVYVLHFRGSHLLPLIARRVRGMAC
jgi:hypothetical protein